MPRLINSYGDLALSSGPFFRISTGISGPLPARIGSIGHVRTGLVIL